MSQAGGWHRRSPHCQPPPLPFHLLEVIVVSAQDLHPAARRMRAYALAWVHPDHKVRTRVDPAGHTDPSWNDKFVFPVDDAFLNSDTSIVSVEIYAARRYRSDCLLGTARIVLSALRPTAVTRYAALQVRRPASLRPQGILNVGVTLLDTYLPLYTDLGPVVAFKNIMGSLPLLASVSGVKKGEAWEVEGWAEERERKAVETKLEKWKNELSPIHQRETARRARKKKSTGCFCWGRVRA